MSNCVWCGWDKGLHDQYCPDNKETHIVLNNDGEWVIRFLPEEKIFWRVGWDDARGRRNPQMDNPVYVLGFLAGEVAREEYENG